MKDFSYNRLLLGGIERSADRTGFIDESGRETFAAHLDRALRLSAAFDGFGLSAGDRVAIIAGNSTSAMVVLNAGFLSGVIPVPINTMLSIPEIRHILADADPALIVVDATFAARTDLRALQAALPGVRGIVTIDTAVPGAMTLGEVVDGSAPAAPFDVDENATAILVYTSGTTGRPKGVGLSQRNLCGLVFGLAPTLDLFRPGNVNLQTGPLYHVAGIGPALSFAAAGNLGVYRERFDVERALTDIPAHRITHMMIVPKLLQMLCGHAAFEPSVVSSIRHICYGGSPMPAALLERVLAVAPQARITQIYGMTEAGLGTCLSHEDHVARTALRSVGKAVPGTQVRIIDSEGSPVARNVAGEVCLRGPTVFTHYWRRPDETSRTRCDGFHRTGDGGLLDDDGYLYLTDRLKDMIISGGENVYSAEVELAIADHPAVDQVAVIGVPSTEWGEAVHAVVVPTAGAALQEADLTAFLRDRIARYKIPKTFDIRSQPLPLSAGMKVLKRDLRAEYQSRTANR